MIQRFKSVLLVCLGLAVMVLAGWKSSPFTEPDAYTAGLALWRTPDKLGRACASCHSPDGIELAAYSYDTATFVRRATPHLGAESAQKISAYFVALRTKLGLKSSLDPMADRPLQPGGSAFPGATALDRDRAFALTLQTLLPRLMGDRIATQEQAQAALKQVLELDASTVRIGISLNRISEDKFHGNEHASLANWIPDVAPIPYTPQLMHAQDAYLSDPSDRNLRELDGLYAKAWTRALPATNALALEKMRSLLLLQHKLRTGRYDSDLPPIPDSMKAPGNPIWEVGELARIYSNVPSTSLALPVDVEANKTGGPSFSAQLREMRLPWLWLGWVADPGLQRTSRDDRTRYADWFSQLLLDDGPYPAHAAFMLTKKLAAQAFDKNGWGSRQPQHLNINFSWILREENWRHLAVKDSAHRTALYKFLANSFRMFAILEADEIGRTGITYLREPVIQQLRTMQEAAALMDPAHAHSDIPIFDKAIYAVASATLVR